MKHAFSFIAAAAAACLLALPAQADIVITEVSPYSSGNAAFAADWFELTNTGTAAVEVAGWKFDDSSNSAVSGVALAGIVAIAPGESVVFVEGTSATVSRARSRAQPTSPSRRTSTARRALRRRATAMPTRTASGSTGASSAWTRRPPGSKASPGPAS